MKNTLFLLRQSTLLFCVLYQFLLHMQSLASSDVIHQQTRNIVSTSVRVRSKLLFLFLCGRSPVWIFLQERPMTELKLTTRSTGSLLHNLGDEPKRFRHRKLRSNLTKISSFQKLFVCNLGASLHQHRRGITEPAS